MQVAVTGSSGKLGTHVVERLTADGHDVVGLDRVGARGAAFTQVDLGDYGQTVDALHGIQDRHDGLDAVVHLAAVPAPGLAPDATIFHTNMTTTFNVFWGAHRAGIKRLVFASSITAMGFPFETPPDYLPLDEDSSGTTSVYALVKHLEEEMAGQLVSWDPELSVTALRFAHVTTPEDYQGWLGHETDLSVGRGGLWTYTDARDGAAAVALALEKRGPGFEVFNICSSESRLTRPTAEVAADVFPNVRLTTPLEGNETLMSIDKARDVLGYEPQHFWRDGLAAR